jgi:thiamine-monophosphate kinase
LAVAWAIDVSDGLAQDLAHICSESGVGAVINFDAMPVAKATSLIAANADEAFMLAVSGGEDFELLFTAGANSEAQLFKLAESCRLPLTCIGEIVAPEQIQNSTPVLLRRGDDLKPLSIRGYDHLAV